MTTDMNETFKLRNFFIQTQTIEIDNRIERNTERNRSLRKQEECPATTLRRKTILNNEEKNTTLPLNNTLNTTFNESTKQRSERRR